MATTDVTLDVGHVFPPGTRVTAFHKVADFLNGPPAGDQQAGATVKQDGSVQLKGLLAHGLFWLTGDVEERENVPASPEHPEGLRPVKKFKALTFTAVDESDLPAPDDRASQGETVAQAERELQAQQRQVEESPSVDASPAPSGSVSDRIVVGARNSQTHPAGSDNQNPRVVEPQPHVKQEDVPDSQPQRSSTPAGQGTPVVPGEPQPRPSQADVKPGTPQRSDTPLGEATPKDPAEQVPQARQEDSGRLLQRSDTPGGSHAPKPTVRSGVRQEEAREASVSKAKGSGSAAAAGTAKRAKGKASSAKRGQAAKAASPVKSKAQRAKNTKG